MEEDGTEWIRLAQYRANGGGDARCLWNEKQGILK
jgi:hypothetical protein